MYSDITLLQIKNWIQPTEVIEERDLAIPVISTDTRSLPSGCLFVALKGEKFDGHDYVRQAFKSGAKAAIVEKLPLEPIPGMPILVVPDCLHALARIAAQFRQRFQGPVFALTGSAGKSSTKNMLGDLLGAHTVSSPKSFNNLLGVSQTLFLLTEKTEKLVLEMGMNAPGEIAEMCRYFPPQYGLITNVGTAHVGRLGGQEGIFKAKKELFDSIGSQGISQSVGQSTGVALNLDDPWVVKAAQEALPSQVRRVTYSAKGAPADVQILSKSLATGTGELVVEIQFLGKKVKQQVPIFGLHQAENFAAAVAGAVLVGEKADAIIERFSKLRAGENRGELFQAKGDILVINESYNSNPNALMAALESAFAFNTKNRRVLFLGEMKELDAFSQGLHEKVAQYLVEIYQSTQIPFVLVGVGAAFEPFVRWVQSKIPAVEASLVKNAEEAIQSAKSVLKAGDLVLVKGSRGIELDKVVNWLKSR